MVALFFYFNLYYLILVYFILFYFYNTHQVLVGLPQGVGGVAILHYLILFYFSLFL
jgi:hypothetical protein